MNRGLLVDTHVFLWMAAASGRLSPSALAVIDKTPLVCVSPISVVELCIKHATGKLPLPPAVVENPAAGFRDTIERLGLQPLPLDVAAAARLKDLPRHHQDPFDRLLIAQALEAELSLVTHDRILGRYAGLDIVWT